MYTRTSCILCNIWMKTTKSKRKKRKQNKINKQIRKKTQTQTLEKHNSVRPKSQQKKHRYLPKCQLPTATARGMPPSGPNARTGWMDDSCSQPLPFVARRHGATPLTATGGTEAATPPPCDLASSRIADSFRRMNRPLVRRTVRSSGGYQCCGALSLMFGLPLACRHCQSPSVWWVGPSVARSQRPTYQRSFMDHGFSGWHPGLILRRSNE
jgi:hypothetical protein